MKLRYFIVDGDGQLRKVAQAVMERVWWGDAGIDALGCDVGHELRIITAVTDDAFRPYTFYLLRIPTNGRYVDSEGHRKAVEACVPAMSTLETEPSPEPPALRFHVRGWPEDVAQQLAVVADVPVIEVMRHLNIGGPLAVAVQLGCRVNSPLKNG